MAQETKEKCGGKKETESGRRDLDKTKDMNDKDKFLEYKHHEFSTISYCCFYSSTVTQQQRTTLPTFSIMNSISICFPSSQVSYYEEINPLNSSI